MMAIRCGAAAMSRRPMPLSKSIAMSKAVNTPVNIAAM